MIEVRTILGAAAIAALPAVASAATILDDFSTLQRVEDAPSALYQTSSTISTSYGSRSMTIDATPDPAPTATGVVTLSSGARTAGNPQDLSFSNDSNFSSVATLDWTFTSPLDLASRGNFFLNFVDTDNPFYLTLTATSGSGSSSVERLLTSADAGGRINFDFSSFGGVDFSDITSLSLMFDSVRTVDAVDADFDNFGVAPIPVPAAGLLLLGGLGALAAVRRRKA